jgi:hypothetical protein
MPNMNKIHSTIQALARHTYIEHSKTTFSYWGGGGGGGLKNLKIEK